MIDVFFIKMSLIETIKELDVNPRHEGDEYEYTSDFLEWFYYNIYLEKIDNYPIIRFIKSHSEYDFIEKICNVCINVNTAKLYNDNILTNYYQNMKIWTINNIIIE